MQPGHPLGTFIVAILVFQLVPGPGTLNILRATANHGMRAGFASVAGTLLGGLVCMLAAAAGLEAVFRDQPGATHALQVSGAFYLAWMGLRLMRQRREASPGPDEATPSLGRHLRQALAVSLTNPKVLLFYFALLPLFFRPPVTALSLTTMIGCVTGVSLAYQGLLVLAGNAVARTFASLPSARLVAQRLAGLAFMVFAIKLCAF